MIEIPKYYFYSWRSYVEDFGKKIGWKHFSFWWRYNLTAGSIFAKNVYPEATLRFYGFTVGQIAIGLFFRVNENENKNA